MNWWSFRTPVVAVLLTTTVSGVGSWPAQASCVELWARKLSARDDPSSRTNDFRVNEQFVVCFRFPQDAFVSLWDVPPKGDSVSRIYPNMWTHRDRNATTRSEKLSGGKVHCFGTEATFPIFFPAHQGVGRGKLSLHVTQSADDQPALDDYQVPGQSILRARMIEIEPKPAAEGICKDKTIEYLEYRVSK